MVGAIEFLIRMVLIVSLVSTVIPEISVRLTSSSLQVLPSITHFMSLQMTNGASDSPKMSVKILIEN
jgi:hypothetical protein